MSVSKYIVFIAVLTAFLASGCAGSKSTMEKGNKDLVNGKPAWFWKPADGDKIGAVGASKPHISGTTAQRQLAISRAIDSVARQMGVEVKNIVKTEAVANNKGASSKLETYSIQTVQGNTVDAVVKEFWYDKSTNELLVWMVVK